MIERLVIYTYVVLALVAIGFALYDVWTED
jgi:hypothetical protein